MVLQMTIMFCIIFYLTEIITRTRLDRGAMNISYQPKAILKFH